MYSELLDIDDLKNLKKNLTNAAPTGIRIESGKTINLEHFIQSIVA